MRLINLIILFLLMMTVNAWAEPSSFNLNQTEIQKILNHWRAKSGIPSATLSILMPHHPYPITFTSGTTKTNTLFQAGSITKSFTSTIILKLESEGRLNIDDPITYYLPQYTRWRNVTIRQLLNHTSGIYNYTEAGTFNSIRKHRPQAWFTPEEIVRIASSHPNYFFPGNGWKYSNTNYILAGMIIQKVTGQSMDAVMDHYLHERLNLLNTYYVSRLYSSDFMSRMAHGYNSNGHDVTYDNMSWANTAGAIVSTTQDLLLWWRGLFQNKILPYEQMTKMMSLVCERSSPHCRPGSAIPHLSNASIGKGYGLGVIQSAFGSGRIGSVWWHNGSTRGYKALVMWYPKSNIYMALTINKDPGYLLKPNLPVVRKVLNVLVPR